MVELSPLIETPIFLLAKDQTAPVRITHLFDTDGEEVGAWEEAHMFVAGPLECGDWLCGLCAEFHVTSPH